MYNAYFILHSFSLHHPPPCVLSHRPFHYYPVAFQGRCAQVFQIYSNRKLTDPHFQQKMWPISIHPCQYIYFQNAQIKRSFRQRLDACRQKHLWEAVLLFWDEDIEFLGYTKWSDQIGTAKDWGPYLSTPTYSVEKNSIRTAVIVIPKTLWWNTPMFYHLWCWTSINNHLFSSNCITCLIDVHRIWSEENIFEVLHLVPLDLQFCHMQRQVRWHVNIFHTYIHQRPLYIMDACQNCVMMDVMARNQLGDQKCTSW